MIKMYQWELMDAIMDFVTLTTSNCRTDDLSGKTSTRTVKVNAMSETERTFIRTEIRSKRSGT